MLKYVIKSVFSFCLIVTMIISACNNEKVTFSGETAFRYLEQQCELGVRSPGSIGHDEALVMYTDFLKQHADTLFHQNFEAYIEPENVTLDLTNIIAGFNWDKGNGLLIGAHWDTRPRADRDPNPEFRDTPILGANDGASGIAVLMHLAEILAISEPDRAVTLVFFDGEDYGYSGGLDYYCMGSEYFSKNLPIPKPAEGIIIDMIGDAELSIPVERYSYNYHPELVRRIWDIAKELGYSEFVLHLEDYIHDDHIPLNQIAGIPTIDIIDFYYPNTYSNYWHTVNDTPDKCSPKSLEIVGNVLVKYIFSNPGK